MSHMFNPNPDCALRVHVVSIHTSYLSPLTYHNGYQLPTPTQRGDCWRCMLCHLLQQISIKEVRLTSVGRQLRLIDLLCQGFRLHPATVLSLLPHTIWSLYSSHFLSRWFGWWWGWLLHHVRISTGMIWRSLLQSSCRFSPVRELRKRPVVVLENECTSTIISAW